MSLWADARIKELIAAVEVLTKRVEELEARSIPGIQSNRQTTLTAPRRN